MIISMVGIKQQRKEMIELGDRLADDAKKSLLAGDSDTFEYQAIWLAHIADAVVSLAPGLSWARDTYEFVTGKIEDKHNITGEK